MIQIVETEDGSHTIFVSEISEHYHSIHGAVQESMHIYIRHGFDTSGADPLNILEIGFGTGLNALLTALRSIESGRKVFYTSVEKFPLDETTINSLNYSKIVGHDGSRLFAKIHSSPWNTKSMICNNFILNKIRGDLTGLELSGSYDLIYFDAFSPEKQPEMWTDKIFRMISDVTVKNGKLLTYCVKGGVKRTMRSSGFRVSLVPGPPGKRHIMKATKI
ncbi:MAG: tRNA (5-methylaminomethyl-2-thiouridine)(34)-methyltransferase MnmD [Bacteroidales bacterium]|nr:tRNA (5-methylaminomethyl-2-thiouridine)(34)-methyltransferase MnmD [Bacteroidales bacterium]